MADITILRGILLDESCCYTLEELSTICCVGLELVQEMVDEGLVHPQGAGPSQWRFTGDAPWRMRTAMRLQRDLGVNAAGAALALDLLEEIADLRRQLGR